MSSTPARFSSRSRPFAASTNPQRDLHHKHARREVPLHAALSTTILIKKLLADEGDFENRAP
jgi:hypothetical protein